MSKKIIDLLKKKNDRLANFLHQAKKIGDLTPVVKQAKEETEWNIDVFNSMPPKAQNSIDEDKFEDVFKKDWNIWEKAVPHFKLDSHFITTSGSGASGTASEVVFNEISLINQNRQYPEVNTWSDKHITEYFKIQSKQNKISEIEEMLKKIYIELSKEFKDAESLYIKVEANVLSPKEGANAMRNVLNHLEGNLLEKARTHPKEQVSKSGRWRFISDRLAIGGLNSNQHSLLVLKESDQSRIKIDLTDICKNTATNALSKLKIIHTQWLDHLYTTLKLIEFKLP